MQVNIYPHYIQNTHAYVWDSPLCKLHKCFDSYMSHSITVFADGSFILYVICV